MYVRFLSSIASQHFAFNAGDVIEWTDHADAHAAIDRGIAEEISAETAAAHARMRGVSIRQHPRKPIETTARAGGHERTTTR